MSMQYPLGSHAADLAELRLVQALLAKAESSLAAANALVMDAAVDMPVRCVNWFRRYKAFVDGQLAAPAYATAAQSASELMARVHAPLPGWDNIERKTAAPTIGERCSSCDQRLDAEADRDTYHQALPVEPAALDGIPTVILDPTRTESQLDSAIEAVKSYREVVARTEAEQAVLDAWAGMPDDFLGDMTRTCEGPGRFKAPFMKVLAAELARRGLK